MKGKKNLNNRTTPIKFEVLERSPGGYITKAKVTEQVNGKKETYSTIYYLEWDKDRHKMNKFIEKALKNERNIKK